MRGYVLRRRAVHAVLLAAVLTSVLSGCGLPKRTELSERLIVEAIGVDMADGGVTVTLEALDLHAAGAGADPGGQARVTRICRFTGNTVSQALQSVESVSGLTPLYSQARLFVLGRTLAAEDAAGALDHLLRGSRLRGDILIAAAQDAGDLLEAKLGENTPGAKVLEDAILRGSETGVCCEMRLFRFLDLMYSDTDAAFCPVLSLRAAPDGELKEPVPAGTAFFADGKWAFTADAEMTRGLLLLTGQSERGALFAEGELGGYGLGITGVKTKVRFIKGANGALRTEIGVKAALDVTEHLSSQNAPIGEAQLRDAGAAAEAALRTLLERSLRFYYYENGADVCRLIRRSRLFCPKESAAFGESLFSPEAAVIYVVCSVTVRRAGKESLRYP